MEYYDKESDEFSGLLGKVITKIEGAIENSKEIKFTMDNGDQYLFYHYQDCCELVSVEDIEGDFTDLLNSPITMAEESTSNENPEGFVKRYQDDSFTWTFYRLATVKGYVTIRWYGESNGYYSEDVSFIKL